MKDQSTSSGIRCSLSTPPGSCRKGGVQQSAGRGYRDITGKEVPIVERPPRSSSARSAEALLASIIKISIVELRGCYGSDGLDTCQFVAEIEPELCKAVGMSRVMELCRDLHLAEDPGLTEWYAARFYQLNKAHFDGCLEDYDVRVVYDVYTWVGEQPAVHVPGHTDLARKRIVLGVTYDYDPHAMDALLIHHMAHAQTKTTCDDDEAWRREMKRLEKAYADVFRIDVEPDLGFEYREEVLRLA
jgi:hypothetical protein